MRVEISTCNYLSAWRIHGRDARDAAAFSLRGRVCHTSCLECIYAVCTL